MYDCTREKISFANGTNNNGPKYPINNIRDFVRNTIINIEKNCSMTINANSQMQIVSYIRKCIVQGKKKCIRKITLLQFIYYIKGMK